VPWFAALSGMYPAMPSFMPGVPPGMHPHACFSMPSAGLHPAGVIHHQPSAAAGAQSAPQAAVQPHVGTGPATSPALPGAASHAATQPAAARCVTDGKTDQHQGHELASSAHAALPAAVSELTERRRERMHPAPCRGSLGPSGDPSAGVPQPLHEAEQRGPAEQPRHSAPLPCAIPHSILCLFAHDSSTLAYLKHACAALRVNVYSANCLTPHGMYNISAAHVDAAGLRATCLRRHGPPLSCGRKRCQPRYREASLTRCFRWVARPTGLMGTVS